MPHSPLDKLEESGQLKRCSDPGAFDPGSPIFRKKGSIPFNSANGRRTEVFMEIFQLPEEYFRDREMKRDARREADMRRILETVSKEELRAKTYTPADPEESRERFLNALTEEGVFRDLGDEPADWLAALERLTFLVVRDYHYKDKERAAGEPGAENTEIPKKLLRGVIRYGERETAREDRGNIRFHSSIFAIPVCAVNLYFALLPILHTGREISGGGGDGELLERFRNTLYGLMLQAWTLPLRRDETDATPFWVERFRNHVWWMGGNAVGYRPVFYTALCFGDSRLMDILGEVIIGASASRAAYGEDAFWTEGICADGFGWGHGAQAYNDGYPTDALQEIFSLVRHFKGTAYEYILEDMDWKNIVRYLAGISWSSWGDYVPPMMGRRCFQAEKRRSTTRMMREFAEEIVSRYGEYADEEDLQRLRGVLARGELEVEDRDFHGTRYFFNNDTLISKTARRYFYFNTASCRCKGVECAHEMADTRNFYIRDGSYLLLTDPDSYEEAKGTFNPSHFPGTTERDLEKPDIMAETNWSGYNSIHNFAGGLGEDRQGVAGFIYEKSSKREADGSGTVRNDFTKEMMGVKAYKSVFVQGELFVFLGAGIQDNCPEYGGRIITTVNNVRLHDGIFCNEKGECIGELGTRMDQTEKCFFRNDGVLYGIQALPGTTYSVMTGRRRTDWKYLNFVNEGTADEKVNLLEITVDHGSMPEDSGYSYWMCTDPDISPAQAEAGFRILSNTSAVQAVDFGGRRAACVFYEGTELDLGEYVLGVSDACVLEAVKTGEDFVEFFLCDPCQNKALSHITVSLRRKPDGRMTSLRIPLPAGNMRGSRARGSLEVDVKL